MIGATIGDFKIKKSKIRGEYSFGMICSGKELGINEDNDGIMILDSNLKLGENLNKLLSSNTDTIFDFDMTPNRGDCFSHLGIARELGIIENKTINIKEEKFQKGSFKCSDFINVNIADNKICKRYSCTISSRSNIWSRTCCKSYICNIR